MYNFVCGKDSGLNIKNGSCNIIIGKNSGNNIVNGNGNFIFGDNINGEDKTNQWLIGHINFEDISWRNNIESNLNSTLLSILDRDVTNESLIKKIILWLGIWSIKNENNIKYFNSYDFSFFFSLRNKDINEIILTLENYKR